MPALGLGVAFFGYTVLYYGVTQVRGMNYGFLDLLFPTRWSKVAGSPPASDNGKLPGQTGTASGPAPAPVNPANRYMGGLESVPGPNPQAAPGSPASRYMGGP